VFELYHGWSYPLDKLAKNTSLTNLTHLHCHPHGLESDDAPYIRLTGLKAVCRSPHLGSLTNLRLRLTDFGDKGVEEIVASGVLKRLKVLDLRHGCMTDEGAKALAACPDLKNLTLLDLSHNALTNTGIKALKATGVPLVAKHMHDDTAYDPDDFQEFLAQGDPE
jgi:Ran GTPase-activating protein (RanGAP) involved in mRNA processing and transport